MVNLMMILKKRVKTQLVSLFFISLATFCFSGSAMAKPLKIVVIFSQTGIAADNSNKMGLNAAQFAVNQLNKNGGVLGQPVEIVILDNQSTPIGSRLAAEKAVDLKPSVVIGASWSSHSLPMAVVLQKAQIPMITSASTNPEITKVGNYIFRNCFDDIFQGKALASFAAKGLGVKRAAIFRNISEIYSITLAEKFTDVFTNQGNILLQQADYKGNAIDFEPLLKKTVTLKPELLFIPGYPRDSGFIIKQADKMGLKAIYLGGDGWGKYINKYSGEAIKGSYYLAHWHPEIQTPGNRRFMARYKKAFGPHSKVDNSIFPLTYDAVMLVADAAVRAGSVEPEKVRTALANTHHFQATTGNLSFDSLGDPIVQRAVILKYMQGEWRFYQNIRLDQ